MFCNGLTSLYMPMLGELYNPLGFFSPMMPAAPKYSINDYNIFGFTPPTNFSYMPWLDNGVKPYNVYPQPLLFGNGNYTPPANEYRQGLFGFLGTPVQNTSNGGIFGFLTGLTSGNTVANPQTNVSSSTGIFGFLTAKTQSAKSTDGRGNSRSVAIQSSSNPVINQAVKLAHSQLGVEECGFLNDSEEIRKYKNGAKDNVAWCGSFVSWCYGAGQGGNNSKTFGYDVSSMSIRKKAEAAGCYSPKSSGYTPQVGDIMVLQYPRKGGGHVGIVVAVNKDGTFETIEGNYNNGVRQVHRSKDTSNLHGFVRMNDWLQA